jgi:hypothetical protein
MQGVADGLLVAGPVDPALGGNVPQDVYVVAVEREAVGGLDVGDLVAGQPGAEVKPRSAQDPDGEVSDGTHGVDDASPSHRSVSRAGGFGRGRGRRRRSWRRDPVSCAAWLVRTGDRSVLRINDHKIMEGRQLDDRVDDVAGAAVSQVHGHVVDSSVQR